MGQVMQMQPLVNEDDCSWSECEHQQDELQQQLEQLAVGQVWTKPQHQNQQPEQVEQEQLLSCRSTVKLASAPDHTIATAPGPALRSHSLE
jgi:hypothetical protein